MQQDKLKAIKDLLRSISDKKGMELSVDDKNYIMEHWKEDLGYLSLSQIKLFSKSAIINVDFETKIVVNGEQTEIIFPDSRKFEAFVIPKLLVILLNDINKSLGENKAVSQERVKEIHSDWLPRVEKWRIATFLKTRDQFFETWESYGKFPDLAKFLACKWDVPKRTIYRDFKQTEEGMKKRSEFFNNLKG